MNRFWRACVLSLCAAIAPDRGSAQSPEAESVLEELDLSSTRGGEDDSASLGSALATERPEAPPPEIRRGEIVSALPGVRETRFEMTLGEIDAHPECVRVELTIELRSEAADPSPVEYRIALPWGSTYVDRSRDERTRQRIPFTRDTRDVPEVVLHPEPLAPGSSATFYVSLHVPTYRYSRFEVVEWPARGADPRAAQTRIVRGNGSAAWNVAGAPLEGPVFVDPWLPAWLRIEGRRSSVASRVDDVLVLVDASPSMRGRASGRVLPTLSTLLGETFEGARAVVVAFGAQAETLVETPTRGRDVPLSALEPITSLDLGSATQPEAAFEAIDRWAARAGQHRRIVVVTDGGMTQNDAPNAVRRHLERLGAPVHVVLVESTQNTLWRPVAEATRGCADHHVEREVDLLSDPATSSFLAEKLREIRTGPCTPERMRLEPRAFHSSGETPTEWKNTRAEAASARAGTDTTAGRGVPAETVLGMLRQRIVPAARGCFRSDRAGRADYSVRAIYGFVLRDREVEAVRVEGEVPDRLRTCLARAITRLDVPYFSGRVVVTYPLRTQAETREAPLELTAQTQRALDATGLFDGNESAADLLRRLLAPHD